jgi:hypothetical protein
VREKLIIGVMVVITIAAVAAIGSSFSGTKNQHEEIYHVMLADSKLYHNGIFSDTFTVKKGTYQFRFVPNGDSPEVLTIILKGGSFSFSEDFKLEGIPHDTGISKYYTWKYNGQDTINIPEDQELQISVNPQGNILGPVSVYLIK